MTEQPADPGGGTAPGGAVSDEPRDYCSYAEFGETFFRTAVTDERILGALSALTGDTFEFGPLAVGPGKIAKVNASGRIGEPTLAGVDDDEVRFHLTIPVDVRMVVHLPLDEHRFHADVVVHLTLTARAVRPLRVFIDVARPTKDDVEVRVEAESMRASLLQAVASVDNELKRFIAKYVGREIEKPHIAKARDIDVAARISGAWERPARS